MPYYRCGSCQLTGYSGAGHSTARICPNCGADLSGAPQLLVLESGRREVRRRVLRDPQAGETARRELRALGAGLDSGEIDVTSLLLTELVANGVKHAGDAAGGELTLEIAVSDTVIRVAVGDGGAGFTPVPRDADPTAGHWGLQLVERLADRWDVDHETGTVVWFELDRVPSGPTEP